MVEIYAADVLDGIPTVLLKQLSYLLAETFVIEYEATNITILLMFNP